MAVARLSSDNAMHYALPVLWMTSCYHVMFRHSDVNSAHAQNESPGVAPLGGGQNMTSTIVLRFPRSSVAMLSGARPREIWV